MLNCIKCYEFINKKILHKNTIILGICIVAVDRYKHLNS